MTINLQITTLPDSVLQAASSMDLGPLQEPPPVPFTFETIGWPVLGILLFVLALTLTLIQISKYRHNRYRREALSDLTKIQNGELDLTYCMVLVKRVAIHAFGRMKVGNLSGRQWLEFLDETATDVQFVKVQKEVEALIYQNKTPAKEVTEQILLNTKNWIRNHATG